MVRVKHTKAEARREDATGGKKSVKAMKAKKEYSRHEESCQSVLSQKRDLDLARCRLSGSITQQLEYS